MCVKIVMALKNTVVVFFELSNACGLALTIISNAGNGTIVTSSLILLMIIIIFYYCLLLYLF